MPVRVFAQLGLLVLLASLTSGTQAKTTSKIILFGADWCGPCKRLRTFLSRNNVQFEYLDLKVPANRERFGQVTGDRVGIPLTFIDEEKIRGANLTDIRLALERKGIELAYKPRPKPGEGLYGGHPASWWQKQFVALRRRVADFERRYKELDKVAVDHHERGVVLARLKQDLEILRASLDQLELDASRVALPRKYRAY